MYVSYVSMYILLWFNKINNNKLIFILFYKINSKTKKKFQHVNYQYPFVDKINPILN